MIRSALPRASQLARNADRSSGHHRRFKAFVKRIDKNNDVYYTLAKKGLANEPDPNKEYEFFEMPNLLLDLDAEGTRHVRSVDDGDEALMKTKWAEVPRREAVKVRLRLFEEQVNESRRKAHAILSQPTNIWRITPHDVVSAALHGGSAVQRKQARDSFLPGQVPDADGADVLRSGRSDVIEKIRAENGIPPHAANEDQLLLHWMLLRYKSLQQNSSSSRSKKAAPSPSELTQALQAQSSLTGIRRLVFRCLAAGTSVSSFQNETNLDASLPHHIRDACARLWSGSPTDPVLCIETLTFLGNLSEQLSSLGAHLGPLLSGTALKLAAHIGSLEATSAWLYRCNHTHGSLSNQRGVLLVEDVLSTLDSLQSILRNSDGSSKMHDARQRQLLFQILTGIEEDNKLTPDSIRLFATTCLIRDSSHAAEVQRKLYVGYLTTLGQLGAARTIWKEWRQLSSSQVAFSVITISEKDDGIASTFAGALEQAIRIMPAPDGELPRDASVDECVTADYHAIEMQQAQTWQAAASDNTQHVPDAATCRSTLDLSFEACIAGVESWRARS
ncbi:hypothetical protein C2857_005618 [Epichloe festucae Fl1]|uniref:Uncharacterized protein n=1 Tax=Epichloe festucae (strain Fl1) TaxID=877507 RepID=A0A7S9KT86_EPIFF|nr:hypothetical protein C2857_005618 [Epichloe festucae Fl1]